MQLRPGTIGMTAMLAMLTAIGPLSTDLFLPSLPGMTVAFQTDLPRVQLTLSVYLFAFAVGQVFYGPLADVHGRRPVILLGLVIYVVASAASLFAPTIEVLIGARALQALGAAAPIVLGRAIVRDVYEGPQAARELSRMGMLMGLVPAIAPVVGGMLEPLFGWKGSFGALLICGLSLLLAAFLLLPETIRARRTEPLTPASIFGGFGVILRHPEFRTNATLTALTFAGLFAFISGSSFVLQRAYGLTPLQFAFSFSAMCVGFIAGAITTQTMVGRWGNALTVRIGAVALAVGGVAMLALSLAGAGPTLAVTIPMMLYAGGVGLVLPAANAGAMMPFPERAGAASSLQGLLQGCFAAAVAVGMARLLSDHPIAMPVVICTAGVAAAFLAVARLKRT
jgi:MFS transporter, DHA1 family, multidrug resistance protein